MARRRLQACAAQKKNIELPEWQLQIHDQEEKEFTKVEEVKDIEISVLDQWGIYGLQFSHDGKLLACGFGNGGIASINLENEQVDKISMGHRKKDAVAVMALYHYPHRENILLTAGASGLIQLWDLNEPTSNEPVETAVEDNEINALDFSLDCRIFATVGRDKQIRLYDGKTLHLLNELAAPDYSTTDEMSIYSGHTKRIFSVKFHPEENNLFITAGWDDCLKIWDKRMAKNCKKFIVGPHICGPALDILGDQVVTGSWRAKEALQLWDLRFETSLIKTIPYPHDDTHEGEFLYCAQFASKDIIIAGGSGTNNACVISTETGEVINTIQSPKPVMSLDILQSTGKFAVGGVNGHLHVGTLG